VIVTSATGGAERSGSSCFGSRAENTSVRGKDNSVNSLVFQTEVRGAGLNHFNHIVESLQQSLSLK